MPGMHEAIIAKLASIPGICRRNPVLDVGCGSGACLARLARHGFKDLRGVDNESMVPLNRLWVHLLPRRYR